MSLCIEHIIAFRKRHRIAACSSCRNNGHTVDRSHIRQYMEEDRMSRLVICCDPAFFFGNHTALFLRSDPDFDKRMSDIRLLNIHSVFLCSQNRRLIQKVFQICSCKSTGCLRNLFQIHIVSQRLVSRMYLQDLFSSFDIRTSNYHISVKTSRT